jgi:hypothetical protein
VRCVVPGAASRSHLVAGSRHPPHRSDSPPPAGSGKDAATREGGSGIGIYGAGNLGSVLVGVVTGPSRLGLEEGKWAI